MKLAQVNGSPKKETGMTKKRGGMLMFCKDCGEKTHSWQEFCKRCGADLFKRERIPASNKHSLVIRFFNKAK